jgi:aminoglycoside phosphotransferase (APT) family kinase protein
VSAPDLDVPTVVAFLEQRHGGRIDDVEPLLGGHWSSAFAYRCGGREFVLRVGSVPEGFELDLAASAYSSTDLPIPEVLEVGEGLGASYAISVRHHGRFLESIGVDDAPAAAPAVERTLAALRAVPWRGSAYADTWRGFLLQCLADDPTERVSGWRATLATDPELDRIYSQCEARIGELIDLCPERRDLIHGDLLNRNVLIADDNSRITAVFSWKCAVQGDFLYDIAWCTFWGPWHPGIAALDLFGRTMASPPCDADALVDASARHHCYELHIGARHLAWNAWTHNDVELRAVAAHTQRTLESGVTSE